MTHECSNHHPSPATLKSKGIKSEQGETVSYIYNFIINIYMKRDRQRDGETENIGKFLSAFNEEWRSMRNLKHFFVEIQEFTFNDS